MEYRSEQKSILKSNACFCSSQRTAQIDFVVQKHTRIIPVEVKSGTQGAMQSLRLFMQEKNITKGVRTFLENFAQFENIDVCPMYAIANLINNG